MYYSSTENTGLGRHSSMTDTIWLLSQVDSWAGYLCLRLGLHSGIMCCITLWSSYQLAFFYSKVLYRHNKRIKTVSYSKCRVKHFTAWFTEHPQLINPDCQQLSDVKVESHKWREPFHFTALPDPVSSDLPSHSEPRGGWGSSAFVLLLLPQGEAVSAAAKPRRNHQRPGRRWVNFDLFALWPLCSQESAQWTHVPHVLQRGRPDRCHKSPEPPWKYMC